MRPHSPTSPAYNYLSQAIKRYEVYITRLEYTTVQAPQVIDSSPPTSLESPFVQLPLKIHTPTILAIVSEPYNKYGVTTHYLIYRNNSYWKTLWPKADRLQVATYFALRFNPSPSRQRAGIFILTKPHFLPMPTSPSSDSTQPQQPRPSMYDVVLQHRADSDEVFEPMYKYDRIRATIADYQDRQFEIEWMGKSNQHWQLLYAIPSHKRSNQITRDPSSNPYPEITLGPSDQDLKHYNNWIAKLGYENVILPYKAPHTGPHKVSTRVRLMAVVSMPWDDNKNKTFTVWLDTRNHWREDPLGLLNDALPEDTPTTEPLYKPYDS